MTSSEIKPLISLSDLEKIDIRVGTIKRAEDVVRSRNLVKLIVDFGAEERIVVAGLKSERSDFREIENKQALFVVNLKPREIAGVISEAMLFDIGYADKIVPVLAIPERPVPDGSRAG